MYIIASIIAVIILVVIIYIYLSSSKTDSAPKPAPEPEPEPKEIKPSTVVKSLTDDIVFADPAGIIIQEIRYILGTRRVEQSAQLLPYTKPDKQYKYEDILHQIHRTVTELTLTSRWNVTFDGKLKSHTSSKIYIQSRYPGDILRLGIKSKVFEHDGVVFVDESDVVEFIQVPMPEFTIYTYINDPVLPIKISGGGSEGPWPIRVPTGLQSYEAYLEIIRNGINDIYEFTIGGNNIRIKYMGDNTYEIENASGLMINMQVSNYGLTHSRMAWGVKFKSPEQFYKDIFGP